MRRTLYYKRLVRLFKIIDSKINNLPDSLPFESALFYPDENKTRLSDSEFSALMEIIEAHFKNTDEDASTASLGEYMTEKKIKAQALYNAALIEKSYFYQILSGKHTPSRDTTIRITLAMKLRLSEAKKLLQTLGYSFFDKNRRDIIIMACIERRVGLYTTELILDKYGEVSLCSKSILLTE